MNLAATLAPMARDAKQALRLRRFGISRTRASIQQLRMFADNIPAMTISLDENLHCTFANTASAEFFGLPVDRIVGLNIGENGDVQGCFSDRFKPVNDTFGHTAGDKVLIAAATRIRTQVRESDTVARIGGDEFTVILPDIDGRAGAQVVAGKIIAALIAPFPLGDRLVSVEIGTSIGISMYPDDALEADELVKAADAAMYRAKQRGSSILPCAA